VLTKCLLRLASPTARRHLVSSQIYVGGATQGISALSRLGLDELGDDADALAHGALPSRGLDAYQELSLLRPFSPSKLAARRWRGQRWEAFGNVTPSDFGGHVKDRLCSG
jgi:hypothetical protein